MTRRVRNLLTSIMAAGLAALCASAAVPTPRADAAPGRMPAASSRALTHSGIVADAKGAPMTGTFLLDFRLRSSDGRTELWRETIYVEAVDGVFHAELGLSRPLPLIRNFAHAVVEVSAPTGSGWTVRPLPAPTPATIPKAARAGGASVPLGSEFVVPAAAAVPAAREDGEVAKLQKELQRTKAELESQKSAVRPSVYVVQPGDTLRSIAEKTLGNPERWGDLYQANDDRLLRGGDLVPGQKLIIPRDVTGPMRREKTE